MDRSLASTGSGTSTNSDTGWSVDEPLDGGAIDVSATISATAAIGSWVSSTSTFTSSRPARSSRLSTRCWATSASTAGPSYTSSTSNTTFASSACDLNPNLCDTEKIGTDTSHSRTRSLASVRLFPKPFEQGAPKPLQPHIHQVATDGQRQLGPLDAVKEDGGEDDEAEDDLLAKGFDADPVESGLEHGDDEHDADALAEDQRRNRPIRSW